MKNRLLTAILCLGLLTAYVACEKDDSVVKETNTTSQDVIPTIKTVSYDKVGTIFNRLKSDYKLEGFLLSSEEANLLGKSTIDTLGVTIYTDEIKEVTVGDYTSYTMRIASPSADNTKFYNVTIEDKNGESGMFVTKYTPTENWLENKNTVFDGGISTHRVNNDITEVIDDTGGFGGTNNYGAVNDLSTPEGSPYYPSDCDGIVIITTEDVPYQCTCEDHWPWNNCHCPENGGDGPGYNQVPFYHCDPYGDDFGDDDPFDPNDTYDPNTNPGGGAIASPPDDSDPSLSVMVTPGPYEVCLMNGNSDEVCDCVQQGETLGECNTDCAQLNTLSDVPLIKSRLYDLKVASGNFEKGLKINKNPNNDEYVVSSVLDNNSGTNHINIIVNGFTAAIAHTHTSSVAYKMFSAPDILKMAQMADRIQSENLSTVQLTEITHILVFENSAGDFRTYALRFDDAESVQTLQDIANDRKAKRDFNKKLKKDYESDYSYETYTDETDILKQQRHLFDFLDNFNLNISIYEANFGDDGRIDNWQKINKNTLEQEPCN